MFSSLIGRWSVFKPFKCFLISLFQLSLPPNQFNRRISQLNVDFVLVWFDSTLFFLFCCCFLFIFNYYHFHGSVLRNHHYDEVFQCHFGAFQSIGCHFLSSYTLETMATIFLCFNLSLLLFQYDSKCICVKKKLGMCSCSVRMKRWK